MNIFKDPSDLHKRDHERAGQRRGCASCLSVDSTIKDAMVTRAQSELNSHLAQVALGNRAAFEALYDATSAKLLAVCLRVLKERAAAEDAMQEAYVKIWKNAHRFEVTGHSPMSWLITIARNTAVDKLRARKDHDDLADHEGSLRAPMAGPEAALIAKSEAGRIMACLQELEADRAAAIRGAYLDGDSYQALSDRFKVPLNTMRTWLRRGLMALRECMTR